MIFATNNVDKLKQLKDLAPDLDIHGLKELGIQVDVEEDGETFEDNAIKKAVELQKITGECVVADDSGLQIDFFDGWPGVYTHRFIPSSTAEERNQAILQKMENVDESLRGAKVVCVLAVCDKKGNVSTYRSELKCKIAFEEKGDNYFGFDSIVLLDDGRTMAELTDEEKEKVNARSLAFKKLLTSYENDEFKI